jgi:hypothetical protein
MDLVVELFRSVDHLLKTFPIKQGATDLTQVQKMQELLSDFRSNADTAAREEGAKRVRLEARAGAANPGSTTLTGTSLQNFIRYDATRVLTDYACPACQHLFCMPTMTDDEFKAVKDDAIMHNRNKGPNDPKKKIPAEEFACMCTKIHIIHKNCPNCKAKQSTSSNRVSPEDCNICTCNCTAIFNKSNYQKMLAVSSIARVNTTIVNPSVSGNGGAVKGVLMGEVIDVDKNEDTAVQLTKIAEKIAHKNISTQNLNAIGNEIGRPSTKIGQHDVVALDSIQDPRFYRSNSNTVHIDQENTAPARNTSTGPEFNRKLVEHSPIQEMSKFLAAKILSNKDVSERKKASQRYTAFMAKTDAGQIARAAVMDMSATNADISEIASALYIMLDSTDN